MHSREGTWEDIVGLHAAGFGMDADSHAHEDSLTGLLGSRDAATCIVETFRDGERSDYRFIAASPAFGAATGLHDAIGRTMRELRPDHEPYWFELYEKVARSGIPAFFQHGARALERDFRGVAFRVGDPGTGRVFIIFEKCAAAVGHDAQPVTADDSESGLGRFGATLAHELRGPLASLFNGLHIVRTFPSHKQEFQWAVSMMQRQFARVAELIDDLLDVGRLGSGNVRIEHEHVDLYHIISESFDSCAAAAAAHQHEVKIDSDGTKLLVRGDRRRLAQVFVNLLTNSIRYTPDGGHIRVSLMRAGNLGVVEVTDDGSGISVDDLPHVFDLYNQGRTHRYEVNGGLGIGLSIVRNIVQLHGGTVSARSPGPNQGATFTVRLPLSD